MPQHAACRLCSRDCGIDEFAQKPSSVEGHEAATKVLGGFSSWAKVLLLRRGGYWAKVVHAKVPAPQRDGKGGNSGDIPFDK
jgi:hypothetical protein